MSYFLEGLMPPKSGKEDGLFFMLHFGGGQPPQVAKDSSEWVRLRAQAFASPAEAQHWLLANAERFVRERVVAVRLLQVVAHYAPHCIAFFPEIDASRVAEMERPQSRPSHSPYDGTPGDEWKKEGGA